MINEKSCGAVIFREENGERKYLVIHYERGHWEFVKGHSEQNETEKETVIREIKEETGLSSQDVTFIDNFRIPVAYFYKQNGQLMRKEVAFYLLKTTAQNIQLGSPQEHIGYEWLSYADALGKLTYKNSKGVLEKAHQFLGPAARAAVPKYPGRDWKQEYAAAKQQKNAYLEMLYRHLKKIQVEAAAMRSAEREDNFLMDIIKFKFKVVPTVWKSKMNAWGIADWIPYEKWVENGCKDIIDYYTILPLEIIFESDYVAKEEVMENGEKVVKVNEEQTWNDPLKGQKTLGNKVIDACKRRKVSHTLSFSGGKGPHTHVLLALPPKEWITKLEAKGIRPHHYREYFFNKICDWAKIPKGFRRRGGEMDIACVRWDDSHLVRCFGGRKFNEVTTIKNGAETKDWKVEYKTLLEEIPERRPEVPKFTQVRYPDKIEQWLPSEKQLEIFISEFKTPSYSETSPKIKYNLKGEHINLPCMRLMRHTPAPKGVRNDMARQQAFACVLDALPLEKALEVCEEYYSHADKEDFDFSEAKYCFEWAYRKNKKDVYISCPLIRSAGFCTDSTKQHCKLHLLRKKEFEKKQGKKKRWGYYQHATMQPRQLQPYAQAPSEWMRRKGRRGGKPRSELEEWRKKKEGD